MLIIGANNPTPQTAASAPPIATQKTAVAQLGIVFDDKVCACPPSSRSKLPGIDEATVLTEVEINTATHIRTGGDPLIVRGTARAGATVRIYNPDIIGWPEIAQTVADATGNYQVQVDDASKFARGDRVLVTAQDPGKQPSGGVMRATVPFTETTHVHSTFVNSTLTNRSTRTSLTPDFVDADDRAPYYDDTAVKLNTRLERGGMRLELSGAAKAVPPGSKLSLGGATAVAGDDGRFLLTVRNAQPGAMMELRVTDIHGRLSTVPVGVRSLRAELHDLATTATWTASGALNIRASMGLTAGDVLAVRDPATGTIHRLVADGAGKVEGQIAGLAPWSTLEVGLETQGIRSNELTRLAVLPSDCGRALHVLDDAWQEPSLGTSLGGATLDCIEGQDLLVMPEIARLPPFGRVDVMRGGAVAYTLRADAKGRTPQAGLADVTPGEVLSLRSYDAGGRRLGVDVASYMVPALDEGAAMSIAVRASENAPLSELIDRIGSGTVAMPASGERAQLRAPLVPESTRLRPRIDSNAASGRTDLNGSFPAGTMPETEGAHPHDAARLAVVDWETGQRNIVFELYQNGKLDQQAVRVPLTVDGSAVTVRGDAVLPGVAQTVAMLSRTVGFAALARSLGAGPGDAAYDGPMRAARSLVFALDRIALSGPPEDAAALRAQAATAIAAVGPELVDASSWVPGAKTTGATPATETRRFWAAAQPKQGLRPWEIRRAG